MKDLLHTLNLLSQIGKHYLGSTITAKYWQVSRPNSSWSNQFVVERSARISFSGSTTELVSPQELQELQQWANAFVKHCSQIIQDFSSLIDPQQLAFALEL